MAKIRKIEPVMPTLPTRKKVAAYARVSMETERLHHSLSAQVSYYSDLIQRNPEWEYAGVYADDGITGTKANSREEFQRMLEDCEAGKIDIILIKSISRFARNTVDLLETVRHLKELGVSVRFEKENIDSLSGDGEVMLTLLASFAQEEIRSLSENEKWNVKKRFEQGIPVGKPKILGYEWEGSHLVLVPEEAAIVKRIFQNFLDGKSRLETERELNGEGITTKGGYKWCDSNIKVILTNITYTGNMLFQKEYIEDPITKKRRKNKGELPQYWVENTHEAIIDMETFQYVQDEMARRRKLGALANKSLNTCCFTGKIKCPYCGFSYMHHIRKRENGTENYWKCGTTKKKDGRCPVKGGIRDDKLRMACADALGLDEFDETAFLAQVDHIEVPKRYQIEIHLKDGRIIPKDCTPTGHQDCWTQEYRDKVSEQRRKNGTNPKGASCFTAKIKCAECGNNYRRQTRKRSSGEKYYLFACATTKDCSNNCIHEDVLKELAAEVLGLSTFDDDAFTDQVDHVDIAPGGHITFVLKDGTSKAMTYSTKRRVAGYARVSTDHDDQFTSYEAQIDYYTKYIKSRDDWEFVQVYTDEGITGTSTKQREGFRTMVADALDGKIDLIVTKSVSRFARNTVDSLTTIRQLKEKGIEVYFEKENIWTFDGKGELLLTIMSSLAQEESRSISENCTWGQRKRFADGKVSVAYKRFLGYDKGADGNLVINPEQAVTIRRIYQLFLQGMTYNSIAQELTKDGVLTPGGKTKWSISTVRSILSNEKYKGDALLQKSYTVDFLTKKTKINEGEIPQYYVEGNHEAIIDPDVFEMVQREIE